MHTFFWSENAVLYYTWTNAHFQMEIIFICSYTISTFWERGICQDFYPFDLSLFYKQPGWESKEETTEKGSIFLYFS